MISAELRKDMNVALCLTAAKLDLDATRYKNANEKYQAVAKWLQEEGMGLAKYSPCIYPQGSFALGTVVKPLSEDEYDIDFVCELDRFIGTPNQIKKIIGDRLRQSSIYQSRLEEMNRCWRLNYSGEFHMDILPAKSFDSDSLEDTALLVPDKDLHEWVVSDPKGYAAWFKERMLSQFSLNKRVLEEKSVDPVPDFKVKTTLQQAIQLIKRNRDITYEFDGDDKPISIIITTLAGHAYLNQSDLFEALLALVKSMPNYIQLIDGVYWVTNPVNQKENFADKWIDQPQRRIKLLKWLQSFEAKLMNLHSYQNINDTQNLLHDLFGEAVTQAVLKEMAEQSRVANHVSMKTPPTVEVKGNKPWSN